MPKRALLSVSDKTGLVDFARALAQAGYDLISTGGTAKALRDAGLQVSDISDVTGFPEMMDGRVKTLHPKVHGGLLFLRDNPEHAAQAQAHDIAPIDLVVVNLYPFEQTIAKADVTLEHAIENIDIGGPSMLRSAAKNYRSVTVITDPADYTVVAGEIGAQGDTTLATRERLAAKVFRTTGYYDSLIANYLGQRSPTPEAFPETFALPLRLSQTLRYGENPHQAAALYGPFAKTFQQLHGKELSYNNLIDITAAVRLIREFHEADPTVAILKHTNPCGVGSAESLAAAWDKAYATDKAGALRRHHRREPSAGPRRRPAHRRNFQRGDHRPILRRRCAGLAQQEKEPPPHGQWRDQRARPPPRDPHGGGRFVSRPGRRRRYRLRRELESRHEASAHRGRTRCPALRLARGEAPQVQCHRLRDSGPHAGRRRRPDVPHRFLAHRRLEGR